MIDLDKLNQTVKDIAQTAEFVFETAKSKISGDDKKEDAENNFDLQQIFSYVDQFLGDYIKKHSDFKSQVEVKIKTLPHFKGNLPQYESSGASGLDVRAQLNEPMTIAPGERVLVPTALSMEVPIEYEIQARPRSGLSLKKGLTLVNTPGTIDADYRGEIKMIMINLGKEAVVVEDQERIAQLVICPVVKANFKLANDLSDTSRGEKGFGSTGSH